MLCCSNIIALLLIVVVELENANLASLAASEDQVFSPASSHHTGYHTDNPCSNCGPATPITPCDQYSSNPSTPMQLSSPQSHQNLHSTPHGPGNACIHTIGQKVSQQHSAVTSLIPNCSPLVKADLHPGSPIMAQTNGPQVRKNIFQTVDGITRLVNTQSAGVGQWTRGLYTNVESATASVSNIPQLGLEQPETTGYLHLLNEAIDQYNTGELLPHGANDLFSTMAPCSTINNSIGCISLPKPEPVTMVSRAHGQGLGKKGRKKTKKGMCSLCYYIYCYAVFFYLKTGLFLTY